MNDGVVFERRLDRATGGALLALFGSSCLGPLAASDVSGAVRQVAEALAFTSPGAAAETAGALLCLAPVLVTTTLLAWAFRRFSRATVFGDLVVIEPLGLFRRWGVPVALDDIVQRWDASGGVLLDAPAIHDRLSRLLCPLLVPARDAAERARIHALLDASLVGLDGDRRTASGGQGLTEANLVAFAIPAAITVTVALSLAVQGGAPAQAGGALLVASLVLGTLLLLPRRRRIHLGRTGVAVGEVRAPWSDVARLSADEGALYLELASGPRRVARPGAEAVRRLLEVARARLPTERVGEGVPAWARARRRRLLTATLALALSGLWLGPVRTLTREGCLRLEDHLGNQAWLVHRRGTPRLLLIVDPPVGPVSVRASGWLSPVFGEPGGVEVDLRAGRVRAGGREHAVPSDATVVHVGPGGVRASTLPLAEPYAVVPIAGIPVAGRPHGATLPPPDEVQLVVMDEGLDGITRWGGTRDDPVVRDALDGRTSVRCLRSGRLHLRVERGRVESLILLDRGLQEPWGLAGCWSCALARAHPGRLVRLTAEGPLEADLPSFDDALAAFLAAERAFAVEAATAGFAGPLWAAPLPVAGER
ncbi:MAG: hypothetical protein KF878_30655 [Planctomycetes bacterium]|nr:hypothetical protein [Planctomycetota bacterium]